MEREVAASGLGLRLADRVGEATFTKSLGLGVKNAQENKPFIDKTIADLPPSPKGNEAAIVIVGGPSLHRQGSIERIRRSGFPGPVIVADGSLGNCLRQGLIPDYAVSVDGHPTRIVRWFGDSELASRPSDDYFTRQDLDPEFWENEKRTNGELIDLLDAYGPRVNLIAGTSVHVSVTRRAREAGMPIWWWNPILDDYDAPGSSTRKLFESNGAPCMVTGGNVGTSAWVFAHSVLGCRHVGLVGMDLGYAPGTPLRRTQYYTELVEILGESLVAKAYIDVHNPHLKETWFTDPTYYWYRKAFIDLAADADCTTYNCTEGGTLFSDDIEFLGLDDFLRRFGASNG